MTSQLIGIGVGTGDADLITVKAYKLLQSASADNTVLAYIQPLDNASMARGSSMARRIVTPHIADVHISEIILPMPMQTNTASASAVYDKGAEQILHAVQSGKTVLFLCEGDPLFYGSFMYIYDRLHRHITIHIIPGINSVASACSVAQIPFASRNDICTIIPATVDATVLTQHLQSANSIAIMKIGQHLPKVKTALRGANRLKNAICVQYATLPNQCIIPVSQVTKAPYFSIIISTVQNLY